MSRIFISYARADVEFARKLARSLSEMGAEVWLDINDIPAGMKWSSAIQQGLNVCQVMLLIISPESMASNNVEDEWQYYLDEKKPIIPLWYRPAKKHFQISRLQHVDFHEVSYHIAFNRLLRELQGNGISIDGINTDASGAHSNESLPITPTQPTVTPIKPTAAPVSAKPTSQSLMPAPFAWIDIPGKDYSIAKYPVTNDQYAKFIQAGGYGQKNWWTEAGWKQRQKAKWTQPQYWTDRKLNGVQQPVCGVSWYEALAFCLWLSDNTGQNILLPTEDQWQYAAQGDDGRVYPWGNQWDSNRCNNYVGQKGIGKMTSVRQYERIGDSPFRVVDMAGNVWEWCLTDFDRKANDVNDFANSRVLRGGSWNYNATDYFRCDYRTKGTPNSRLGTTSFRLVCT